MTNEIQQKIDYLTAYKKLHNKIKSLDDQMKSLEETIKSAKAIEYSDMPKGSGKQTDLSDYIVRMENMQDELMSKQIESIAKRAEIELVLFAMDDGQESMILHRLFIDFRTIKSISKEIGYSETNTREMRNRAIENLVIPEELLHQDECVANSVE